MEKIAVKKVMDNLFQGNFVSGQVASDGSLILVYSKHNELDYFERPVLPRDWTIYMIQDASIRAVSLRNLPIIPSYVDIFPDGTLLVVQPRCEKDDMFIERNAHLYDLNGQYLSSFIIGDGIEHVQIDCENRIWVGYFDEGIFGNFGWDDEPIGQHGLVVFDKKGQKLWEAKSYNIADCYMLNVTRNDGVYFHYYDDFHLVKLNGYKEIAKYHVQSDDTIDQFILAGDEMIAEVDLDSVVRFSMNNNLLVPKSAVQWIDADGHKCSGQLFMRDNIVYLLNDMGVYVRIFEK